MVVKKLENGVKGGELRNSNNIKSGITQKLSQKIIAASIKLLIKRLL